jgi:hypothetical protein
MSRVKAPVCPGFFKFNVSTDLLIQFCYRFPAIVLQLHTPSTTKVIYNLPPTCTSPTTPLFAHPDQKLHLDGTVFDFASQNTLHMISQMQCAITPITTLTPSHMLPICPSPHAFITQIVLSASAQYLPLGAKNPHPCLISTSWPPTISTTSLTSFYSVLELPPYVALDTTTRIELDQSISHFWGQTPFPLSIFFNWRPTAPQIPYQHHPIVS